MIGWLEIWLVVQVGAFMGNKAFKNEIRENLWKSVDKYKSASALEGSGGIWEYGFVAVAAFGNPVVFVEF